MSVCMHAFVHVYTHSYIVCIMYILYVVIIIFTKH